MTCLSCSARTAAAILAENRKSGQTTPSAGNVRSQQVFKSADWGRLSALFNAGALESRRARVSSTDLHDVNRRRCMSKFAIRLLTLAIFSVALAATPVITAVY